MATKKIIQPVELKGVIDDGTREVPLYNKFGKLICKIYFRPADFSIIDRYNDFIREFDEVVSPLKDITIKNDGTATFEEEWETLKRVEDAVKDRFNKLFDMEEADDIFAKRNVFSSVGGEFFCAKVLSALGDVITQAVNEEAELSHKRVSKYMAPLQKGDAVNDRTSTDKP